MPELNVLVKPSSGLCNIRCSYCFYHDETKNREVESYGFMTEETLEKVIKRAMEYAERSCTIMYQGGEPTLRGLDFFRHSIELEKKYNRKGIRTVHSIQTNGILLDAQWAEFFRENDFLVGISLDGLAFTHNSFRKGPQGEGTFERVVEAIGLLEEYGVEYNILTVVNAVTAKKASRIYEAYGENGYRYLQFIPCMNPLGQEKEKYPFTLTPKAYGQFLKTLFDCWYQDLQRGRVVHIQPFEGYIKLLLRQQPDLCGMSGICACQHIVEADGEVYPCDFYVLDKYKLGNLKEASFEDIQERLRQLRFIETSVTESEECRSCRYFPICRGGCRRYRHPKNYFCASYRDFFAYALHRLEEAAGWYAAGRWKE